MKLLLLAGTTEARQLAQALAEMSGVDAVASLAGVTRAPKPLVITTRVGGFGGAAGLHRYVCDHKIDAVIIATHPFAAKMAKTAASVSVELSLPCLRLLRPAWRPQEGERWVMARSEADVAALVPEGARVFLATGPARLADFSGLETCEVFCRRVDEPTEDFPFSRGKFIVAKPPFSLEEEQRLFAALNIDWLVARNSGDTAGRSKLDVARALGLGVALIERPRDTPDCPVVSDVGSAIDWVRNVGSEI